LSPRELEVLKMLARGRDRAYIEEKLVVSRNTVKAHVKHIYAKLGIHSHQDLIALVQGE
jgi:DNA-binding NarL/FixJ family response regulator